MVGQCMVLVVALSLTFVVGADDDEKPVCYHPLGCFFNNGPWFSLLLRPFPAPDSPKEVGTQMFYFNRENKENGNQVYKDLEERMNNTGFDSTREKTFFIIHGFMASGNSSWMTTMKDAVLNKMDANVFVVDWREGADTINYFQAASDARIVGAEIARFIKHLQKHYNLDPTKVHLIGHSLGAQIASYAAKNVTGIGRITGLDPAQPGFEGLSKEVRIDKNDAEFVDIIHTNIRPTIPTLGFGMISPAGVVDIYVNGGLDQPGCYTPDGVNVVNIRDLGKVPFKVLAKWISCSHMKAYEYFTASLDAKCTVWARKSGKVRSLVNAVTLGNVEPITAAVSECTSDSCTVLGIDTPKYKAEGVFAATTVRQYPFCDESDPEYDRKIKQQILSDNSKFNSPSNVLKKLNIF